MKRLKKIFIAICLAIIPVFYACEEEEGYAIGNFTTPSWATIATNGDGFYLYDDTWGTLWPINQSLHTENNGYQPTDGQRVIATYNPISDNYYEYDHAVKILSLTEVLTKGVEILTPENEETLGNDPITIHKGNLTIGGNHMNIIYQQEIPAENKHRITLVRPASDDELLGEDGYLHLQLRYNTYNDITGYQASNAVSFNLESLPLESAKGIKLKLHSKVNGEIEIELPYYIK